MMVKILTLTGDELEMNVDPTDTIHTLKEKLEEREGIPIDQQRIIYQGKKIRDDQTFKFYKITAGTTLHLVIALRGGLKFAHEEATKAYYRRFIEPDFTSRSRFSLNSDSSASTL